MSRSVLWAFSALLITTAQPASAQGQQGREPVNWRGERFVELFDTNGDKKVTIDEITADQARLFGALDIDGDGALSVAEVRRRGRLLRIWRTTTTMFDMMDANGDQKLTRDEVSAPSKRWFKRYDENGDGAMEAAELPSGRRHRH